MQKRGERQFPVLGSLGGILPGPTSEPDSDTGHGWLDERTNAGVMDAAFNANDRQKNMAEVGEHQWTTGEADKADNGRFLTNVGESRHLDQQGSSGPRERLGLQFNVVNEDASSMLGRNIVGQEPVQHVYRGMSEDEFQEAKGRGHIASDERGVIQPGWEGTNATTDFGTAHNYLPREGPSRIVKMAVHPDDQWFTSDIGDYPRTRAQIPWDRVMSHTSVIDKSKTSNLREQVVEKQKREGALPQ
jgi:hypothetical protein